MDFGLVMIALGDISWILLAFLLGYLAQQVNLPPLVGFLATGFLLNFMGVTNTETLQKLADLGITLLLFVVGLKLNLKVLIRPQVWAVTGLHTSIIVALFGMVIFAFALIGIPLFSELDFKQSLMIAFALSFSSTVFVVKSLEESGEMKSLHGRIAIGILVMQDLAAVVFLAASTGKIPSPWAALLFLLVPLRPLLHHVLQKTGHGELLLLYGLVLALGGAMLFEIGGIKGDLGALIMGVLISTHEKSKEMAKTLFGLKDLFLVGFFLSIGMSGQLTLEALIIGIMLVPFIFVKSALFFVLMTRFKLRSRTSLLATLKLTNYSEFGLIVAAIGVSSGWLNSQWLVVIAIALSLSFALVSRLNTMDDRIYHKFRDFWIGFQNPGRLPDDKVLNTRGATIAIFGVGRVGSGAFEHMRQLHGDTVVGVDFDADLVKQHQSQGHNIIYGDPSDADFWDKMEANHNIRIVMLALPNIQANLDVLEQLQITSFPGNIAAIASYPDEGELLLQSGATTVFNIFTEAGAGFADHVDKLALKDSARETSG